MPSKQVNDGPLCPKCKTRRMIRNGNFAPGRPKWTCITQRRSGADEHCYSTTDPSKPYTGHNGKPKRQEDAPKPAKLRVPLKGVSRVVVTWAQNATPVHQPFLDSLKAYCKHNDATLLVIAGRYKNPTSAWTASQENAETWAPELAPYLYNQRKKLNANLVLAADVKIQPTAVSPTTGFDALTGAESCILGHPKVQMRCIPTPQSMLPKILTTTGAVTKPNFTDSAAGKKGEFHHSYGAAIVELRAGKFHLRHVAARADGAFIDLDKAYYPDRVEKAPRWPAIVFGDAHWRFSDHATVMATFRKGGLVDTLNPESLVWHDLLDAYAVNPHHEGNPMTRLAKYRSNFDDITDEVTRTVDWLCRMSKGRRAYVVASNHDDMLSRWVMRSDWKSDPKNAEFYLETALAMARSARMEEHGAAYLDPFQYWVSKLVAVTDDVTCLRRGESKSIKGVEVGMHGDQGPGGARGSVKNLSRLGVKTITGHGHSPAIEEGHTRVGTMSKLSLEYNTGPSAWLNSHGGIDAFGKRHLFHIIEGQFRL